MLDFYWRVEGIAFVAMRKFKDMWLEWAMLTTHYGEEHLDGGDHKMTLVEQTALTSRNITGGYLVNLLTGYISLQTEHHLFPMMPTAHLDKAQPYVRDFFKKHKLVYRESNLLECVKFNIAALNSEVGTKS